LRQQGLLGDALQALDLLRVLLLFLHLDGVHVDGAQVLGGVEVLVEGVGRVDGVELFGGIFALCKVCV
jgi:hypothetical protein